MSWALVFGMLLLCYLVPSYLWYRTGDRQNPEFADHIFMVTVLGILLGIFVLIAYANISNLFVEGGYVPVMPCNSETPCEMTGWDLLGSVLFGFLIYWQSFIAGRALNRVSRNS